MPTYEYACKECGQHTEVVQSFKDDPLTTCPACSGPLKKVFGNIGIAFKGSGFYKTDSRSGSAAGASAKSSGDTTKGDAAKGGSTTGDSGKAGSTTADSGKGDSAKSSPASGSGDSARPAAAAS